MHAVTQKEKKLITNVDMLRHLFFSVFGPDLLTVCVSSILFWIKINKYCWDLLDMQSEKWAVKRLGCGYLYGRPRCIGICQSLGSRLQNMGRRVVAGVTLELNTLLFNIEHWRHVFIFSKKCVGVCQWTEERLSKGPNRFLFVLINIKMNRLHLCLFCALLVDHLQNRWLLHTNMPCFVNLTLCLIQ